MNAPHTKTAGLRPPAAPQTADAGLDAGCHHSTAESRELSLEKLLWRIPGARPSHFANWRADCPSCEQRDALIIRQIDPWTISIRCERQCRGIRILDLLGLTLDDVQILPVSVSTWREPVQESTPLPAMRALKNEPSDQRPTPILAPRKGAKIVTVRIAN